MRMINLSGAEKKKKDVVMMSGWLSSADDVVYFSHSQHVTCSIDDKATLSLAWTMAL